jgi:hypothetical protein
MRFLSFFVVASLLLGCTPSPPHGDGSLLIIAISNFRADDLTCGLSGDSITPQLDTICKESVRFTHAYTPSVLGVPALASIFTGLYPTEHGVHRNGPSHYLPGVKNLPEGARERGLETFFVSGGVPFLRKTAISKGFTDFDDTIRSSGSFYRKATETMGKLINLIENRSEETPFLGVAQLVDLGFPEDVLFKTNREEGSGGKLQEIDEAIGLLRTEFSRLKIWDPLTVVIVGLQGNERAEHNGISKGLSLYDEIVRIPLLIKPARKPRDQGPSWKVDAPVTLVDLGQTLFKLLKIDKRTQGEIAGFEFLGALAGHDIPNNDRAIFSESDLPPWRGWGPRLVSARLGEWIYWLPPEPKLFNTYTDHLELRNLISIDPNLALRMERMVQPKIPLLTSSSEAEKIFKNLPYSIGDKLRVAKIVFSKTSTIDEKARNLSELEMRRSDDWQVVKWHVDLFVGAQDWLSLRELLANHQDTQNTDMNLWQTFLRLRTHSKPSPNEFKDDPLVSCLYLASSFETSSPCRDPETQAWINAFLQYKQKHNKEALAFFELARGLTEKRLEQTEFAKVFWSDGATWDYNVNLPEGPAIFSLFLALTNNSEFLEFTKKRQLP